jgi:hypothetical protein
MSQYRFTPQQVVERVEDKHYTEPDQPEKVARKDPWEDKTDDTCYLDWG